MERAHTSRLKLICIITLLLLSNSFGSSYGTRQSVKSSIFSLFNLKSKSRFWNEAVIRSDFDDLEASVSSNPGRSSVLNYTKAGNVANYLKLMEAEAVYLPIPANFIFIGFEGKGNHEFKLEPEELERWFTKIDHIFEHTRVPYIGDTLSPFPKMSVEKDQRHHLPFISPVNYNFSVHAIRMGEKVTSVFEHAIKVLSHKDNIDNTSDSEDVLYQVDMDRMGFLFSSLVKHLQLENAYNIFILNPKHGVTRAKYGYRRGLSDSEINLLKENKNLRDRILQSEMVTQSLLDIDTGKNPLYVKHPMEKFAWTSTEDVNTEEWSNICFNALSNVAKSQQDNSTADIVYQKMLQILHGQNKEMKLYWQKKLKSGELSGIQSECLTDTWIGKDRWAFIDLSAGPFSWGPTVGGEGVRTENSLPNVAKTIGAVEELSAEEAEDRLQDAIQEKFAVLGDQDHHAVDILLAEIDIYELFAFKHCKGRKVKLPLCEELDERMRDLRNELQAFDGEEYDESHRKKAIDALKRMEKWNLFTVISEEFQNYTVARDSFLAHLGASLWGSMRHIISPSVAEGAYHYYDEISFQLFFISQEKVGDIKNLPVDLRAIKEGLSSLCMPSQKAVFSPHILSLTEDTALAMAFSIAKRAAAIPLLLANGTYRSTIRTYLDSSILQYQLKRLNDHGSLKGRYLSSRSTLEVPIFWFIQHEPLLVDKHYQARALSDMVVVVQSSTSSWESHFQCNGQSLLWDLRWPMKSAVAATAEHLGGLIPLHLVYSQSHETVIEDWTWSVGCNPLSITSQGWLMSQFQIDTLARSYIITTLEESIQATNAAVHRLVMEKTTTQTFKLFKSNEGDLVNKYNSIVSLWRRISTVSGELRFTDAVRLLSNLEDSSKRFVDAVNTTLSAFHPIHCTRERKVQVEIDMTTIPAFLVVLALLWFVLRPRRPKPKIN